MPVIYYLWNWTERPDSDIVSSSIFFNLASGLARNIIAPLSHCQDETDPSLDWIFESWWDQENIESRSTFSNALYNSAWWSKGAASSNTVLLALALPDKNAATEICYVTYAEIILRGAASRMWTHGRMVGSLTSTACWPALDLQGPDPSTVLAGFSHVSGVAPFSSTSGKTLRRKTCPM